MNLLPNFLVVGAPKCGTSSLWKYLDSHPQIFIPEIKECRFFSGMRRNYKGGAAAKFQNEGPRELDEYLDLFSGQGNLCLGDCSNDYFYYYDRSINKIKDVYTSLGQRLPKIVIILRDPAERVFSMFHHSVRLGSETLNFSEAFLSSKKRIDDGFAWVFDLEGIGNSFQAVRAYHENFEDVFLLEIDDLSLPSRLRALQRFLHIEVINIENNAKFNENLYKMPHSKLLSYAVMSVFPALAKKTRMDQIPYLSESLKSGLNWLRSKQFGDTVISLDTSTRCQLNDFYADDLKKLRQYVGNELLLTSK